jgi:DNA repair protein SbcC/Rad50
MKLKSMKLENIRSYKKEQIEFPNGSLLLSGNIGSGKSTILQAIEYAIFGVTKGASAQTLLRHGAESGYVNLNLEVDGMDIIIERGMKKGKSIKQEECSLIINGKKYDYTTTQLKSKMLEIFGYPREVLTKNIPIFRYTVYTPQEQMKAIMTDPTTRLSTLRKIFNIEKYENIRKNSVIFTRYLSQERKILEGMSTGLDAKREEVEKQKTEKETVAVELNKGRKELEQTTKELKEEETIVEEMRGKANEIKALEQKLVSSESEVNHLVSLKHAMKDEVEELTGKSTMLEKEVKEMGKEVRILSKVMTKEHIDTITGEIAEEKTDILTKKAVIEEEIKKLSRIQKGGECPFCLREVSDSTHFSEQIQKRNIELDNLIKKKAPLEEKEETLEKEKDKVHKKELAEQKLEDMERTFNENTKRIEIRTRETAEMEEKILILQREMAFSKAKISNGKKYEEEYKVHSVKIRELHAAQLGMSSNISKKEQMLSTAIKRTEELEEEIKKIKDMVERAGKMKTMSNWIETTLFSLAEKIEKHVMTTLQREFDNVFQNWFSTLMPEESMKAKIDETFSPVITQNNYQASYEDLSGGEKTALALAYRLSLNTVINRMIETIKTDGLLVLDEPTEGFSSEQLDRIRDVITQLELDQIILVSHEPKMDTFVENIMRVYKENHESRIESE